MQLNQESSEAWWWWARVIKVSAKVCVEARAVCQDGRHDTEDWQHAGSVCGDRSARMRRREGERETERQSERETGRQGDRETGREGERERERQGERERDLQGSTGSHTRPTHHQRWPLHQGAGPPRPRAALRAPSRGWLSNGLPLWNAQWKTTARWLQRRKAARALEARLLACWPLPWRYGRVVPASKHGLRS